MRDAEPDVARRLSADFVDSERRQQADDAGRHACAHHGEGIVLGQLGVGHPVKAAAHVLDAARSYEGREFVTG